MTQVRHMKFRDDIDPYKTWVVSDTHFGHENIVGFCHRPPDHEQIIMEEWARTVPEDDTVLHLGDLSYRNNTMFKKVISKHLPGQRKLLVSGNHDRQRPNFYRESGFQLARPFAIRYGKDVTKEVDCICCWDGAIIQTNNAPEGKPLRAVGSVVCPTCKGTKRHNSQRREEYVVSFSHYPWNDYEDGPLPVNVIRIHGHIHNNGYTRAAYVPFLKQHINVSIEQTHYRPVNLGLMLDAALFGEYERDQVQLDYAEAMEIKKNAHVAGENDPE